MEKRVKITKSGSSYQFRLPSAAVEAYDLLKDTKTHEWKMNVYNNGKIISFKKVKKQDPAQTKLSQYKK